MKYLGVGYYISTEKDFNQFYCSKDITKYFSELDERNFKIVKVSLKEEYREAIKADKDNTFYFLSVPLNHNIENLLILKDKIITLTSEFKMIPINPIFEKFINIEYL